MKRSKPAERTWKKCPIWSLLTLLVACGAGTDSENSEKIPKNSGNSDGQSYSEIGQLSQRLFLAARVGDLDRVASLVRQGASVNQTIKTKNGQITPLLTAIIMGHADVAHYLVLNGADRSKTFRGYNPDDFYVHKGLHRTGKGNMFVWPESEEELSK